MQPPKVKVHREIVPIARKDSCWWTAVATFIATTALFLSWVGLNNYWERKAQEEQFATYNQVCQEAGIGFFAPLYGLPVNHPEPLSYEGVYTSFRNDVNLRPNLEFSSQRLRDQIEALRQLKNVPPVLTHVHLVFTQAVLAHEQYNQYLILLSKNKERVQSSDDVLFGSAMEARRLYLGHLQELVLLLGYLSDEDWGRISHCAPEDRSRSLQQMKDYINRYKDLQRSQASLVLP